MDKLTSQEIRQDFFDFFKEKAHAIVPSAPVVPKNDPTLLFTNAGMNQFKPIFLGEKDGVKQGGELWKRAADTQRCIRVSGKHNDLEEVGVDTYHHTLFEMLGNWSFGDYFKKEAIRWAWELLVERWGLEADRLYATVFEGDETDGTPVDEEAIELWKSETNINPDHILTFGKKDNFWEMGETGPCGPCSEVHIDLRPDKERNQSDGALLVNQDDPRVMEIWNLVFIQFNRLQDSTLEPLPAQHVDTGMGFERICAILQDKKSNYDSDLFQPLLLEIGERSGKQYGQNNETDIAMRVIADHIRAVSFSIADGAAPGNEGRGYVVRRILRRAIRYGWDRLNLKKPFLHTLVPVLAEQFRDVFPVLYSNLDYVINVVKSEEQSFLRTLGQGIELFEQMVEGTDTLSGDDAFKLHDTFGFPIDLTQLMARERGISVNVDRFNELMQEQKERARESGNFKHSSTEEEGDWITVHDHDMDDDFKFVGYDEYETETRIRAFRKTDDQYVLLLDKSPFYAESGGQVSDTGILTNGKEHFRIVDVQKSPKGFLHFVNQLPEDPSGNWRTIIDKDRRREIRKHHSATHLIHAALRQVLGEHVAQKGSFLNEHHLRFDFSHFNALNNAEIDEIEQIVNSKIQENIPLQEDRNVPIEEAKKRGAMMLFGEKYGEKVRVITFDSDYSVELCGGTHVNATGEIGYLRLLSESSAASGIRRIEAVAGREADEKLRKEKHLVHSLHNILGQTDDLARDVKNLMEEKKNLEKEAEKLKMQAVTAKLDDFLEHAEPVVGDIEVVKGRFPQADMNTLKQLGYDSLQKCPKNTVTVLASAHPESGKVYMAVTVTEDLIKGKKLRAGDIVSKLGQMVGGGGGGQPNLATAGGRDISKLSDALDATNGIIKELISD